MQSTSISSSSYEAKKNPVIRRRQKKELSKEEIEERLLKKNQHDSEISRMLDETVVHVFKEVPKYRKVVFVNQRDPGVTLDFHYQSHSHPIKDYHLTPGIPIDLPEEIISHIENLCIPQYGTEVFDENLGRFVRPVKGYKYHFSFRSAS